MGETERKLFTRKMARFILQEDPDEVYMTHEYVAQAIQKIYPNEFVGSKSKKTGLMNKIYDRIRTERSHMSKVGEMMKETATHDIDADFSKALRGILSAAVDTFNLVKDRKKHSLDDDRRKAIARVLLQNLFVLSPR
jgi:hypothetical protein